MKSLYDFPQAYDAVMNRPSSAVEAEVNSIIELLRHRDITEGRVLELACGACAHGLLLAARGFGVMGIDLSAAMLDEAQRRAEAAQVSLQTAQADVVSFDLEDRQFVAAIFMFETFPVITAYHDIVSHFAAVRKHLASGGLYVVDLGARRHGVGVGTGEWSRKKIPLPDGWVESWCEEFPGDWVQGTSHLVLHCNICLQGHVHKTQDDWHLRVYSP
jgi:cyclopropane fatty-acyl-phospholipid synthase-like methyltransferase